MHPQRSFFLHKYQLVVLDTRKRHVGMSVSNFIYCVQLLISLERDRERLIRFA